MRMASETKAVQKTKHRQIQCHRLENGSGEFHCLLTLRREQCNIHSDRLIELFSNLNWFNERADNWSISTLIDLIYDRDFITAKRNKDNRDLLPTSREQRRLSFNFNFFIFKFYLNRKRAPRLPPPTPHHNKRKEATISSPPNRKQDLNMLNQSNFDRNSLTKYSPRPKDAQILRADLKWR